MVTSPYQSQLIEVICETPDVRVAEITLPPRSDTPVHQHTEAEEICYCLLGELTCEVAGQTTFLKPGERMRFASGQDHQLRNNGDVVCRFLLVHGGGRFDFLASDARSG